MRWLKGPVDHNPPTFAKEDGLKEGQDQRHTQEKRHSKL